MVTRSWLCRVSWFAAGSLAILALAQPAAAEWGDLQVRFVYDGEPPKPDKLVDGLRYDERLVVNAKNRGLANVAVWLHAQKDEKIAVHSSYEQSARDVVTLLSKDQRFQPHVLLVRTSQTLAIDNQDARGVYPRAEFYRNTAFNYAIPANTKVAVDIDFQADEPIPVPVQCSIPIGMSAWLLVRKNPYMAVSDTSGKLTIRNLPAGERTFRIWHERIGFVKQATIRGEERMLDRGRLDLQIEPGANDLGEVLLEPGAFKK